MGRLIDADKLKADLEKAISKNEDMDCLDFLRIASVIDKQPTAYDPNKVVEQLEADKRHTFDGCINKRYEIEIVKAGGNADLLMDRAKSKSGERIPYDSKWK